MIPPKLQEILDELVEADKQERVELLIDLAKGLPPLPSRLESHKDATHRVEECQSPVYLFVEPEGNRLRLYADVPSEALTVRSVVSLLVEGLDGSTAEEILRVPDDLMERAGLQEILGMQRIHGLHGVLRRLKREAARAAQGDPAAAQA